MGGADGPRFSLLETISAFASEQLELSGEAVEARSRHAARLAALGQVAAPHLAGAETPTWLARLDPELDNLRAAITGGLEAGEEAAVELAIAATLWRYWLVRGLWRELRTYLERLIAAAPQAPGRTLAEAQYALGYLLIELGDLEGTCAHHFAALDRFRALGDERGEAWALGKLATALFSLGAFGAAERLCTAAHHACALPGLDHSGQARLDGGEHELLDAGLAQAAVDQPLREAAVKLALAGAADRRHQRGARCPRIEAPADQLVEQFGAPPEPAAA